MREKQDQFGLLSPETRVFRYTLDHFGRKHFAAAFRKAVSPSGDFHAFRRGLATNLFELGLDDRTVMRILRHVRVQITRASYIKGARPRCRIGNGATLGSRETV